MAYYFYLNTMAKVTENSSGIAYSAFTVQIIVPTCRGISRSKPRKVSTFAIANRDAEGPKGTFPREGVGDGWMFRSINRNPGTIRADLSEISRFLSQVCEGYRCSAIRTRFASNKDKCVLSTFHLWSFSPLYAWVFRSISFYISYYDHLNIYSASPNLTKYYMHVYIILTHRQMSMQRKFTVNLKYKKSLHVRLMWLHR